LQVAWYKIKKVKKTRLYPTVLQKLLLVFGVGEKSEIIWEEQSVLAHPCLCYDRLNRKRPEVALGHKTRANAKFCEFRSPTSRFRT